MMISDRGWFRWFNDLTVGNSVSVEFTILLETEAHFKQESFTQFRSSKTMGASSGHNVPELCNESNSLA